MENKNKNSENSKQFILPKSKMLVLWLFKNSYNGILSHEIYWFTQHTKQVQSENLCWSCDWEVRTLFPPWPYLNSLSQCSWNTTLSSVWRLHDFLLTYLWWLFLNWNGNCFQKKAIVINKNQVQTRELSSIIRRLKNHVKYTLSRRVRQLYLNFRKLIRISKSVLEGGRW